MRHRFIDEAGVATTAALVLLFPMLLVLMLGVVQAVMWQHSREQTTATAQGAAASVARYGTPIGDARVAATRDLARNGTLHDVTVAVARDGGNVVVTVHATASGIIAGTHVGITVTAAEPVEGFRSP